MVVMKSSPNAIDGTRKACYICGYSLLGHSGEFECPECGTSYDAGTLVWNGISLGRRNFQYRELAIVSVTLLAAAVGVGSYFMFGRVVLKLVGVIFGVVLVLGIATSKLRGAGTLIMVAPMGIILKYPSAGPVTIAWAQVEARMDPSKLRPDHVKKLLNEFGVSTGWQSLAQIRSAILDRLAQRNES